MSMEKGHILSELCGFVLEAIAHGGQLLIDIHPEAIVAIAVE
jgi:hypothetical protein